MKGRRIEEFYVKRTYNGYEKEWGRNLPLFFTNLQNRRLPETTIILE
jgi:hypothetical protein